jgi:hypothetical protein
MSTAQEVSVSSERRVLLHQRLISELESAESPAPHRRAESDGHLLEALAIVVELRTVVPTGVDAPVRPVDAPLQSVYDRLYGSVLRAQASSGRMGLRTSVRLARGLS